MVILNGKIIIFIPLFISYNENNLSLVHYKININILNNHHILQPNTIEKVKSFILFNTRKPIHCHCQLDSQLIEQIFMI